MAVPSSGQLRLYADIGVELGVPASNVSLGTMSDTAGFAAPDAMSDFYGYSSVVNVTYLVVAGGGGAGATTNTSVRGGGGGGAGGYLQSTVDIVPGDSYTVTVGGGGALGGTPFNIGSVGGCGGVSTITGTPITDICACGGGGAGGGRSGAYAYIPPACAPSAANFGGCGGSGGGQGFMVFYCIFNQVGGYGVPGQGFDGGCSRCTLATSPHGQITGGGGGGASQAGGNFSPGGALTGYGGNGCNASSVINSTIAAAASVGQVSGTNVYFAGGGGGGTRGGYCQAGGLGGGACGGYYRGTGGTANTGGGGGGGNGTPNFSGLRACGGPGGSGVVVVRYPNANSMTIGAGLTSVTCTDGSDKVTIFTAGTDTVSWS